ncbi:putative TFIIH and nucleotide excision repair factor 3 complexes subunit [Xylona heveae TC161]|uniref:RNA polymerase II transcription factor B subunit 2 n=1 Tax=Xylona heveae (strain CBS 132557 / TC161) TaxID=1328760 RepID=A0A165GYR4_XYLHT|nr:putative TFIIH and nucleotide excision repair factor 3 complexes subunit [Xylona heveae TC161]KZF22771.1 putative TFIIH and nucleotide excision repair factor 3 complexes subunit [Xylona heveae TC161]
MSTSSLRSFEYLESLPGTVFKRLYRQPSTALAIFRRMLPHLAKSFVMALLYHSHPLPVADLEQWVRPDSRRERDQALSLLERLHILSIVLNPNSPRAYALTNPFKQSLRLALTGGGDHQSFGVPCDTPDKHSVDVDFLDDFARAQWEGILHYMVGSTGIGMQGGEEVSQGVKKLLELGGLVEIKGRRVEITQAGFSFLLQEINAQVWTLLIFYLENAESVSDMRRFRTLDPFRSQANISVCQLNMDPVDVLSFLFMLGSLELGQDYSLTTLTPTQVKMLDDLRDFGIVYQRKSSSRRFYPTRLATTLTSDAGALRTVSAGFDNALRAGGDSKGFIVIETNYRIYAYTSSPLQIAVLALFSRLSTRYPNMVAGRISRESIRRAIQTGITSDQIISYLGTHAHPQMRKNVPVLPPTVVDQIRLWQIEGERMKATGGFLFKDFVTAEEYDNLANYADEVGVLVWRSDKRRMFFVTRHEQIAAYLRNRPKKLT